MGNRSAGVGNGISREERAWRAHRVNVMATEDGGAQARAEGIGASVWSCRGYTPCITILKSSQVLSSTSTSLVIENVSQDCPSM